MMTMMIKPVVDMLSSLEANGQGPARTGARH
jgi:hypothetical protein